MRPTPTPEEVFAVVRDRPGAAWLDAADGSGWSILTWEPTEVATGGDWVRAGRALTGDGSSPLPFAGGCLGFVGFGAGHRVEAVPAEAPTRVYGGGDWEPESWLGRYAGGLCYRHAAGAWYSGGTPAFRADAADVLAAAVPLPPPPPAPHRPVVTMDRARFEEGVERIRAWIAEGDCYQVNLTRAVHVPGVDPWEVYRRLRRLSAAPHGAWLSLRPHTALLSASPELHLTVRDRALRSDPIKGTRPRHADPSADAALSTELEHSDKDRAELAMIVDLVRNDLGRVAVPGSVVAGPRRITGWPTVHHASVAVVAELADDMDAWDALAATFPPGSVTGAPKIRACQRIAQLEDGPRGAYCGVVGYVADGGDATWSVAIRTGVACAGRLRFHVGGGIVADSAPADEWCETVHKGAAWLAAASGPADVDARPTTARV